MLRRNSSSKHGDGTQKKGCMVEEPIILKLWYFFFNRVTDARFEQVEAQKLCYPGHD
jgi:hypothetical protein